ncbi:bifunctional 2-C-methyl-D-erythritol 4-phosphate cytidylyltransferase/2-C-methyl-D-erythritol 2,4-cyclodiphosphate synthase [Roseovarius gahaiensis]|uniref:Bifunctional enzyme IspD/IspF n=1 Tax=Roseovarius gahaiensis TaxID=2716691 RepID=A0A967BFV3_9RHOB|nr:bifunctional 2-C-methyl-D-erythritol 4-phosphate cytidylyltransferase/2-C-methyl-D-erythritol 2,4-cyclodiphosphate synthase [Roseovarius gahaiensis]NHQ75296.1 bifunctional 2-C-methyl-D-erythritol 4-phosphate cytidylyltransferase/2-C-methyl-D-erythritol 2,4-cyclodiphosphate synthase [Roseovarius gahaiensis]
MTNAAIIVAAGRGTRAGGDQPKQWQILAGRPVIDWTVAAFQAVADLARIVVVLHPDDLPRYAPANGIEVTPGGATRAQSVRNGLEYLAATSDGTPISNVLIHDVARCCTTPTYISYILSEIQAGDAPAVAPALPVTDALWRGDAGQVIGTQDRAGLFRAQTPQAFVFTDILSAHRQSDGTAADDVEVARASNMPVRIVDGDEDNLKITHPGDFSRAAKLLEQHMDIRVGNGYDVHRFGDGDHVVLCGVKIPHTRGLQGHSDADVGMHALTDALYGALAMGDIGRHFPPSDPQWKGAESHIFFRHAVGLVSENGFSISNLDVTLVCERPKIGPHAAAMQQALSTITGLPIDRISIKATTSERLGFTGREEGIAAQATATLVKT